MLDNFITPALLHFWVKDLSRNAECWRVERPKSDTRIARIFRLRLFFHAFLSLFLSLGFTFAVFYLVTLDTLFMAHQRPIARDNDDETLTTICPIMCWMIFIRQWKRCSANLLFKIFLKTQMIFRDGLLFRRISILPSIFHSFPPTNPEK